MTRKVDKTQPQGQKPKMCNSFKSCQTTPFMIFAIFIDWIVYTKNINGMNGYIDHGSHDFIRYNENGGYTKPNIKAFHKIISNPIIDLYLIRVNTMCPVTHKVP